MKLVFLFYLDLILHICKIPLRCDSFRILNFATKQRGYTSNSMPVLLLGLATRHLKHKVAQLVSHKFPYIPISIFSNSASKSTDDQGARRPRSAREESSPRLPWKKTTTPLAPNVIVFLHYQARTSTDLTLLLRELNDPERKRKKNNRQMKDGNQNDPLIHNQR